VARNVFSLQMLKQSIFQEVEFVTGFRLEPSIVTNKLTLPTNDRVEATNE